MSRIAAAVALAAVIAAGCHRSSGPSPAYERSQELFLAAVTDKGADAMSDPRTDEALALAKQVPDDSIDSAAAKAFIERVETDRRDSAAADERRREAAELHPDPDMAPRPVAGAVPQEPEKAPAAAPPMVGTSLDELTKRYGACVKVEAPFVEKGGTRQGEVWGLAPGDCETQHPELKDRYVAVLDGRVYNVLAKSAAQRVDAAAPDAGTAAPK